MKRLLSRRVVPFLGVFTVSLFLASSDNPFPYNLYPPLIIISYSIFMEIITFILPRKRTIRLIGIWLLAIILPPVWTANGIIVLYGKKPPMASYDVLLPMLWILITLAIYIYSISVSLMETFQRKN
jgi:hypothetical protein